MFAYHFIPIPIYHHDHHYYHYYSGSNSGSATPNRVYYDYRNTTESTAHQPILYSYKTPEVTHLISDSSSEEEKPTELLNSADYVIAGICVLLAILFSHNLKLIIFHACILKGVQNGLICGGLADDQHQVLFVQQDSDGISLDDELLTSFYHIDPNVQPQFFPDVEFRFDSDDEPTNVDLNTASQMLKELIEHHSC